MTARPCAGRMLTVDIRKGKYILPNLFTLASVFFGVLAIFSCFEGTDASFRRAAIAILIAVVADSLDGRVARMTRTATRFGIQLDSLADVVSFGVAPAVLGHAFILRDLRTWDGMLAAFVAFLFVACGALRLARFNVMTLDSRKPTAWFTGLPIPAAALFLALFVWVAVDIGLPPAFRLAGLLVAMPALSLAMVSTLRYPSFKQVRWGLWNRIGVIVAVAVLIWVAVTTRTSGVMFALVFAYVAVGPLNYLVRLARGQGDARERQSADKD